MKRPILQRLLAAVGLQRIRSSLLPGGDSFKVLWDWIKSPTTIDQEVRRDLGRLRQEARKLATTNPLIRQYLGLLAANVIGPNGMTLQVLGRLADSTMDTPRNKAIEAEFARFWRSPWVDGRMSGIQGEQLLVQTLPTDGEFFVRIVRGFPNRWGIALQMIPADMVDHEYNRAPGRDAHGNSVNEIRLGVEVDGNGRALAFHLLTDAAASGAGRHTPVPAADMIHVFDPERIGQTRGRTWYTSIMATASEIDGWMEAAVIAARTAACTTMVFKHTHPEMQDGNAPGEYNIDLEPGKGFALPAGLEMQQFDPKHPQAEGPGFLKMAQRYLSTGLRSSYNFLANDLEGVTYSTIRAGVLSDRDQFRCLQRLIIDRLRTPVYEAWLPSAVLTGAVSVPGRNIAPYLEHRVIPRGWDWVDPLKDIKAAIEAINNGMGSRSRYCAEAGIDFEEILDDLQREQQQAAERGLVINAQYETVTDTDTPDDEGDDAQRRADRQRAAALFVAHRRG